MPTDVLRSEHLVTLHLDVAFNAILDIGPTPHGRRLIAPITGGRFEGARLNGRVLPGGADWVVNRADGAVIIDVRIALRTDDGAAIYLSYQGSFRAATEAMTRFRQGELLAESDYRLLTVARFECGAPAYAWLNDAIAVGVGRQTRSGPVYDFHEIV
jgi:hypothetical protein